VPYQPRDSGRDESGFVHPAAALAARQVHDRIICPNHNDKRDQLTYCPSQFEEPGVKADDCVGNYLGTRVFAGQRYTFLLPVCNSPKLAE
jgi:hypothetical protein